MAQKDESLLEEMRARLRSDREHARRRDVPPPPAPPPATPSRRTFGDRLRDAFRAP